MVNANSLLVQAQQEGKLTNEQVVNILEGAGVIKAVGSLGGGRAQNYLAGNQTVNDNILSYLDSNFGITSGNTAITDNNPTLQFATPSNNTGGGSPAPAETPAERQLKEFITGDYLNGQNITLSDGTVITAPEDIYGGQVKFGDHLASRDVFGLPVPKTSGNLGYDVLVDPDSRQIVGFRGGDKDYYLNNPDDNNATNIIMDQLMTMTPYLGNSSFDFANYSDATRNLLTTEAPDALYQELVEEVAPTPTNTNTPTTTTPTEVIDDTPTRDDLINDILSNALGFSQSELAARGIDYGRYANDIQSGFQRFIDQIPSTAEDPSQFFNQRTALDTILNDIQSNERTKFINTISGFGAPNTFIQDTIGDDLIESILQEQRDPAVATLDRALARGQLTDSGFNTALGELDNQATSARSNLNSIELDLINQGRGDISNIIDTGRQSASTFTLGQDFDPNTVLDSITSRAGDFTNNFEGNFRSAVGSGSLFDIDGLLQSGGQAQGAQNLGGTGTLFDALAQQDNQNRSRSRGLGSQGAF